MKHFNKWHFLSFTPATLKSSGDTERWFFSLFGFILYCTAIIIETVLMCAIFYCAGISVARAFVMFGFDIMDVKCFSGVTPYGFYVLTPSNVLRFYGFVQIWNDK